MSAQSKIEELKQILQSGGRERIKVLGLLAALVIMLIWIVANVLPMVLPSPPAGPPDTPGWTVAQKLNEALLAEPLFVGTSFVVESEEPLRLKLVGSVAEEEDLEDLRDFVAKLRPENDYTVEVEVYANIVNTAPPSDDFETGEGDE